MKFDSEYKMFIYYLTNRKLLLDEMMRSTKKVDAYKRLSEKWRVYDECQEIYDLIHDIFENNKSKKED